MVYCLVSCLSAFLLNLRAEDEELTIIDDCCLRRECEVPEYFLSLAFECGAAWIEYVECRNAILDEVDINVSIDASLLIDS